MAEFIAIGGFVLRAVLGVLPAFALSIALAVLIRNLKLDPLIRRAFEKREGIAIVLATAVGAFSPLCSCTVIPVVSGLLMSGVPLAPVMAFWVASPTMDPEMFALTVATLGWPLALIRLAATLVLSLGAGYLSLALTRAGVLDGRVLRQPRSVPARKTLSLPVVQVAPLPLVPAIAGGSTAAACCSSGSGEPSRTVPDGALGGSVWALIRSNVGRLRWPSFAREMAAQGYRLGRWLLLAFVLEALIIRYVPQASIAQVLGVESTFAVILAALVGIPLYLNNVSALPIVSGLLAQGMQPGAAVAFLIAGPVTTVPAMSAVWGVVRREIFALYLGVALAGAVVLGYLTNLLLG